MSVAPFLSLLNDGRSADVPVMLLVKLSDTSEGRAALSLSAEPTNSSYQLVGIPRWNDSMCLNKQRTHANGRFQSDPRHYQVVDANKRSCLATLCDYYHLHMQFELTNMKADADFCHTELVRLSPGSSKRVRPHDASRTQQAFRIVARDVDRFCSVSA